METAITYNGYYSPYYARFCLLTPAAVAGCRVVLPVTDLEVVAVNKDTLELWSQMLLEMAKTAKGPQAFFASFQNGFVKEPESHLMYDQVTDLFRKTFGREGIDTFNDITKEFYENVGVVPRTQYNELHDKYLELKDKVQELEARIEKLKGRLEDGVEAPQDLMEQWTKAIEKYTEVNQQFFSELSKFFKQ